MFYLLFYFSCSEPKKATPFDTDTSEEPTREWYQLPLTNQNILTSSLTSNSEGALLSVGSPQSSQLFWLPHSSNSHQINNSNSISNSPSLLEDSTIPITGQCISPYDSNDIILFEPNRARTSTHTFEGHTGTYTCEHDVWIASKETLYKLDNSLNIDFNISTDGLIIDLLEHPEHGIHILTSAKENKLTTLNGDLSLDSFNLPKEHLSRRLYLGFSGEVLISGGPQDDILIVNENALNTIQSPERFFAADLCLTKHQDQNILWTLSAQGNLRKYDSSWQLLETIPLWKDEQPGSVSMNCKDTFISMFSTNLKTYFRWDLRSGSPTSLVSE